MHKHPYRTMQPTASGFLFAILFAMLVVLALFPAKALAQQTARISFEAWLINGGEAIKSGIEWRIFSTEIDETGKLPMLANSTGGSKTFDITPGVYMVHAAYGHASAIRKVEVTSEGGREIFILNAGGLSLSAVAGDGVPIAPGLLRFDIYEAEADERGKRKLIAQKVKPNQIVPFPEGTYHVVSQFGNLNAEIRADLRVKAGQVTNAQLVHRAARVTLRLVRTRGGDALANTQWSVLNESGDLITESTSAFPNIVLSEGNYTAIAKNEEKIYSLDFVVKAGFHMDVEVLLEGQG